MAPNMGSLLLTMLLTLVSADTNQESKFSIIKEISTVITNEVIYTPPMLVLGKGDGSIVRCPHSTPTSCELYHSGYSAVVATVVHGEFLFAALQSGVMLRCSWQRSHSCSVFNQAIYEMTGLAVAAGFIHAGLRNGTVLRCSMNTPHSCQHLINLERDITSLAASGLFIYVGSSNNRIERCDISGNNCSLFCAHQRSHDVTGLAAYGDTVYGITYGGWTLRYDGSSVCGTYGITGDRYGNMAIYNGKMYTVREDGDEIRVINLPGNNGEAVFATHGGAVSISFAYGTYAMQDKYQIESTKCIWRGVFTCPPTVVYYADLQHRAAMEVSVKDGKLFDSQGLLVDTSNADESHNQKAAIFVMGPDGQILLSNVHKTGLLHTSSLLAGNPVSGAGLIVVEQGRIISITACSVHYRPDQSLNQQVQEVLQAKGYTASIDFRTCTYNDTLCIQDGTNRKYLR